MVQGSSRATAQSPGLYAMPGVHEDDDNDKEYLNVIKVVKSWHFYRIIFEL